MAVNRPELAVRAGPLIPNGNAVVLEILYVGIAGNKPQKLIDYRLKMNFLGRKQGEAIGQIEAHLMAENTLCAHTGAIMLDGTFIHYFLQKVKILFHQRKLFGREFKNNGLVENLTGTKLG